MRPRSVRSESLLIDALRRHLRSGRLLGFSPWRDAEATCWGRVLAVRQDEFDVQLVSSIGQDDGVYTYRLSRIVYIDEDPSYARRLTRLMRFRPSTRARGRWLRDRAGILSRLRASLRQRVPIEVRLRGEHNSMPILVRAMSDATARFDELDHLMRVRSTYVWKLSAIQAVLSTGTRAESDAFLLQSRVGARVQRSRSRRGTPR